MRQFVIAVVGLGLVITAPVQAEAVTAVSVTVTSSTPVTVGTDKCKHVSVTIAGDFGGESSGNIVSMEVTNENTGGWEDGDVWFDEYGPINTDIEVCGGYNDSGRYRVDVEVSSYDDTTGNTTAYGSTSFRVKVKQPARSKILRKVLRGARGPYDWSVPGQLVRQGKGYVGKWVRLEVRLEGDWWKVSSMKTGRKGSFGWVFKRNRYTFRYAYLGDRKTMESASAPFRTPSHRREAASAGVGDLSSLVQAR